VAPLEGGQSLIAIKLDVRPSSGENATFASKLGPLVRNRARSGTFSETFDQLHSRRGSKSRSVGTLLRGIGYTLDHSFGLSGQLRSAQSGCAKQHFGVFPYALGATMSGEKSKLPRKQFLALFDSSQNLKSDFQR